MNRKFLFGCIFVMLLILLMPSISAILQKTNEIVYKNQKGIEERDVSDEWKVYPFCFISGYHFGDVGPEHRIGPAVFISVGYGSHNIDIYGAEGRVTISELKGFGFFGYIQYYSIPRIPATIIGFILFCYYKE